MKFSNAAEAIQYYVTTNAVGITTGAGQDMVENAVRERVDTSLTNKAIWADMVHARVDIENILTQCFPQEWIQRVMMHWAVDGYDEAINGTMLSISQFHNCVSERSRERMLGAWIRRLTNALSKHDYLKVYEVDFNQKIKKIA